jgi:hypothetical protein
LKPWAVRLALLRFVGLWGSSCLGAKCGVLLPAVLALLGMGLAVFGLRLARR